MIYDIKEFLKNFLGSRLFVLAIIIFSLFAIIIARVFSLQIINGAAYQENFTMQIQKPISVDATRGNIYDCNGRAASSPLQKDVKVSFVLFWSR